MRSIGVRSEATIIYHKKWSKTKSCCHLPCMCNHHLPLAFGHAIVVCWCNYHLPLVFGHAIQDSGVLVQLPLDTCIGHTRQDSDVQLLAYLTPCEHTYACLVHIMCKLLH
jgi:hypothetical protein